MYCLLLIIQQEYSVSQNLIAPSPITISEVTSSNFFIHDIFLLDATAVKRIRGCVADFILVVFYIRGSKNWFNI